MYEYQSVTEGPKYVLAWVRGSYRMLNNDRLCYQCHPVSFVLW